MGSDEYWNGDSTLTVAYRKADKIKEERINQRLWLQGMYFYEALCDASPLFQAFAKKGTKAVPYASEPYAISKEEIERRKKRQEQIRYEKTKAKLAMWAANTNVQIANRSERGDNDG